MIDLLAKLNTVNEDIRIKTDEIQNLSLLKAVITTDIQRNCKHPEDLKVLRSDYYTDEYGSHQGAYTEYTESCYICNKITRKYTKYATGRLEEDEI